MTENPQPAALPRFFDANPRLKAKAQAYLATLSEEDKRRDLELMEKFVSGEMSWAELKNIPPRLMKYVAKIGYMSFKTGDLAKAEAIFKGLAVMDHRNWYFRAALGAVFQKQKRMDKAIEEYSAALELNPDELTSLVNRGQCRLMAGETDAARTDLDMALEKGGGTDNPWIKRAQALRQALEAKQKASEP